MNWRNPSCNAFGSIDCEIEHPQFGWIPFTASSDDIEPHGRELFEALKDIAAPHVPPPPDPAAELAALREAISAERDRRLALDFAFQGVMYQRDSKSLQRIAGAAQMAALAVAAGAQPGDLHWHGAEPPFGWIASDDSVTPMDAPTVIAFAKAAAARETALIFAARALRQMDPVPEDFAQDRWWP